MKLKVLNLYSGLGGNRKLWPNDKIQVTAVEINPDIAAIYKDFFPDDNVIIDDAHKYLLEHYKEYDFIWSSPPCPTHSVTNNFLNAQGVIRYPDMNLYQEIILLQKFYKGIYCIENVKSYYDPLIKPQENDRHYFWANFYITPYKVKRDFNIVNAKRCSRLETDEYFASLSDFHGINIDKYQCKDKRKALRNCVYPKLGLHIFNCAFNPKEQYLLDIV